eukprot:6188606-Pleurochrysis_carterae.AAC.1
MSLKSPVTEAKRGYLFNLICSNDFDVHICVSFSKGCYIGQETIAKLASLEGPKQQLWGFLLDEPPVVGDTDGGDGDGDGDGSG